MRTLTGALRDRGPTAAAYTARGVFSRTLVCLGIRAGFAKRERAQMNVLQRENAVTANCPLLRVMEGRDCIN